MTTLRAMAGEPQRDSGRYLRGMERLLEAVQELSQARELPEVQHIVRHAARELTGCDGAAFVLRDDEQCYYADEDAIEPLWKGRRFPLAACISGWTMLHRQAAVIPDIYADARIPHEIYRRTFVKSLLMVPIRTAEPIGAIGNYWASRHHADAEEVRLLQALADATAIAIENVQLYRELQQQLRERSRELEQAQAEIGKLSITDALTGLHNRRGFHLLAEQALQPARRQGSDCLVLIVDVDGFKRVNDEQGHEAGDAMIVDVARLLHSCLRDSDIVARTRGDEFRVLAVDPSLDGAGLRQRLLEQIRRANDGSRAYDLRVSIDFVQERAALLTTLDQLLSRADAQMREQRRARRQQASD